MNFSMDSLPTNVYPWHDDAACATNPEPFFKDHGGSAAAARRYCQECPVRIECLNQAMTTESGIGFGMRAGIWGGLTPAERWDRDRVRVFLPGQPQRIREPKEKPEPTGKRHTGGRPLAPCGTRSAHERHKRKGEDIDPQCAEWFETHRASRRRQPAECGTHSGYSKHIRNREEPCQPCRDAKAAVNRELRNRPKQAAT
ncbi:WhiB family transcriptional regulator [Streptomyces chryseus]